MAFIPVLVENYPQNGQVQPANSPYGGAVTNKFNAADYNAVSKVPWCIDPESTWLDYRCGISIILDPGSVLHKPLPQSNPAWDTLGSLSITDPNFGSSVFAVNLNSKSQAVDIIQRMASSTYRFVLHGSGQRVGYQIPIPSLLKIGDLIAIPTNPHMADNILAGSIIGGIPMWEAEWELHYIVTESPTITQISQLPVVPNPAAHTGPNRQLTQTIQGPFGVPDYNTVQAAPPAQQGERRLGVVWRGG